MNGLPPPGRVEPIRVEGAQPADALPPPLDGAVFEALVETGPDGVVLVDRSGTIVFMNRRSAEMFGYAARELRGQSIDLLVPIRSREEHAKERRAFVRAPHPRPMGSYMTVAGLRKDGSEFPIDVSLTPLRTGTDLLVAATIRDVTERKQSEEQLREAEQRFRLAFDNAPTGAALIGLDGRFWLVNRPLAQMLGRDADELRGLTFQSVTHPDDREIDRAERDALVAGTIETYRIEKRYIARDGEEVPVAINRSVARSSEGAALYYVTLVEDLREQRRAAAALRTSERRFSELIDQAPDAIFIADPDGRYVDVNPAACDLLGYTRDELIGKRILDIIPPADGGRLQEAISRLRIPGSIERGEWILLHKGGAEIPVELSSKLLADGRIQAFVRDVRERQAAERALRRSEEMLARAQRVAHIGSWDWDLRTNIVERSRELYRLVGVEPVPGLNQRLALMNYVHPDDRARVLDVTNEAARTGCAYSIEHRMVRRDGELRYMLQQGEPILEDGRPVRIVGTLLDMTARKLAEREREQSRLLLQAVLDECPVGIVLVQPTKEITARLNHEAQRLTGRDEIALDAIDFILGADHKALPASELPGARAMRGEHVDWRRLDVRQPDGQLVPILAGATPIRSVDGEIIGAVVALQDVTAQEELARLRAEWSSVIAHDLRQPLNSMLLAAQLALRSAGDLDITRRCANQILASGRRLDRMIHDLMDLSRLEANRLRLRCAEVDLPAVIRASVVELSLDPASPEVHVRVDGTIPTVMADTDRLLQIMANLFSNAVKYGRRDTAIDVEVRATDHDVSVAVTNEGEGISAEDLPRLFQRFERASHAKGAVKGIGLGLHITRGLVEAHGGHIEVTSTPGRTTTFRFTIPVAGPTVAE